MNIEQIDRLCDEYESLLKGDSAVSAEEYLERNQLPHDDELLSELARVERDYRDAATDTGGSTDTATVLYDDTRPETAPRRPADAERIGKYEVLGVLGSGGQAVTYKARDPDLDRLVVIKLYHAADSPEAVLEEGRALAKLRSPYVAQCFGVDRHEGAPFLIVEYVSGGSLAAVLKSRRPSVAESLEIVHKVAVGLGAVHACGLLHRDIKPGNILIGDDGQPRLVDFGLARGVGHDSANEVSGTLAYMPPEQARGESDRIGPHSDVFALGAVLYHLLCGKAPLKGADADAVWASARECRITPLAERNPDLPADVERLCTKCLGADPAARFSTAGELAAAIESVQKRRSRRTWAIGTAAIAASLLVAAGIKFFPASEPAEDGTDQAKSASAAADAKTQPKAIARQRVDPATGKPLRQDFPLKVEMLGTKLDEKAGLHRIRGGQLISFRISSPQNCYVGIWYTNGDGKVMQLFPNEEDPDYIVQAGKDRLIPGERDYTIPASTEEKPGYIHVIASTQRWNPIAGRQAGPFAAFSSKAEVERLRSFHIETRKRASAEVIFDIKID